MSTMDGHDETTRLIRSPRRENDRVRHIRGVVPSQSHTSRNRQSRSLVRVRLACFAILLTLVLERMSFYGLAGNLVLFLNKEPFAWKAYHAINASLYLFGVAFISSFFGGWIADSCLGRYKAVLFGFFVYLAGYVMVTVASPTRNMDPKMTTYSGICAHKNSTWIPLLNETTVDKGPFTENCAWFFYPALLVIGVGAGFVKANIPPFGADQLSEEGQEATLVFFNWLYWCINIGALIGMVAITYVEQQMNFFYGYMVGCSALAVAMLTLLLAGCSFKRKPPVGSVLTKIFKIINEARKMKKKRQHVRNVNRQHGFQVDEADSVQTSVSFLDHAKHRHGGIFHDSLVEDVKVLKKILAVFLALIPYWVVYFQMQTTFLDQGLHMKMDFVKPYNASSDNPEVVAAWLNVFDILVVISLLPLMDLFIYPWLERSGCHFGVSKRMGVGMLFAISAMLVAGVVEHFRLHIVHPNATNPCEQKVLNQTIAGTIYYAADMSIFWQIPQFTLIGISEVFTSVAGLQFACSVAPKSMKSIMVGLFYLFSGIGSLLGTAILSALTSFQVWFIKEDAGDINKWTCNANGSIVNAAHLDFYFYLLAGIGFLGFLIFVAVANVFSLDSEMSGLHSLPRASKDELDYSCSENGPTENARTARNARQIQRSLSGPFEAAS